MSVVTERDVRMLQEIDRFGYLGAEQVAALLQMPVKVAYRRLRKLVEAGYLLRRRYLPVAGVYLVSVKGLALLDDPVGRYRVRLGTIEHNLAVADAAVALLKRYPGAQWVTERELRREAGHRFGKGYQGRVPDGALILPGGIKLAVEYENTAKSRETWQRITRHYLRSDYSHVIVLCRSRKLAERLRAFGHSDLYKFYIFEFKFKGSELHEVAGTGACTGA